MQKKTILVLIGAVTVLSMLSLNVACSTAPVSAPAVTTPATPTPATTTPATTPPATTPTTPNYSWLVPYPAVRYPGVISDNTKYKKSPPYNIAVSEHGKTEPQGIGLDLYLRYAASMHPEIENLWITDAQWDSAKQLSDIEDLLARKPDAILIDGVLSGPITPVVESLYGKTPVFLYDIGANTDKYVSYHEYPCYWQVQQTLAYLNDKLHGTGNIVMLEGIAGSDINNEYERALKDFLGKYPGLNIISKTNMNWDPAAAKTQMAAAIAANPKIDAVICCGPGDLGAAQAWLESNRKPWPIFVGGQNNGFLKIMKTNNVTFMSCFTGANYCSWDALNDALSALQGLPVAKSVWNDSPIITQDNIDSYVNFNYSNDYQPVNKFPKAVTDADWGLKQ